MHVTIIILTTHSHTHTHTYTLTCTGWGRSGSYYTTAGPSGPHSEDSDKSESTHPVYTWALMAGQGICMGERGKSLLTHAIIYVKKLSVLGLYSLWT